MAGRNFLMRAKLLKAAPIVPEGSDDEIVHAIDGATPRDKRRFFRALSSARRGAIIEKLSEYSQESIFPALSLDELRAMIDGVESDDAVDIIQMLPESQRTKLLTDLRRSDPHGLLPLLVFGEETAGGLMKTEFLHLHATLSVDEARHALAKESGNRTKSHLLYIVDDQGALVGTLTLVRLIQAAPNASLREVMTTTYPSVAPTIDQEQVAQLFDEQNAIEIPVVGLRGKVLGVITADDIFEVMEKEYAEDISRLVGVHEDDRITDPVHLTVRRRLPWLIVNLATAILAAWVVTLFQGTIQRVVILAAYMPIIAGMGGNAATQTLGVVIRAIALGELDHINTARAIIKEVLAGTLNGFVNGVIMGAIAYAWSGNFHLALVILAAMTVNLFIAGLGGVAIPITMKAFRIDPALASTVFVTTLTDCCGFFVFLGLASLML